MDKQYYKLIFADDEHTLGILFKNILEAFGHEIILVTDGYSAVDSARNNTVDIMILDYHMPYLNGFEVYEQTRDITPSVPCILISGDTTLLDDIPDMVGLYKLAKPFRPNNLATLISVALMDKK